MLYIYISCEIKNVNDYTMVKTRIKTILVQYINVIAIILIIILGTNIKINKWLA